MRKDLHGDKNPMWGRKHSEETKRKIGLKSKEFMNSEKAKHIVRPDISGENNPMYGKKHSDETKAKIGAKSIGRITITEERKLQRSEEMKGEGNPFYGKHHSEETKSLLHDLKIGKPLSCETRKKLCERRKDRVFTAEMRHNFSLSKRGKLNPAWVGGTSFGKYCPKFNKPFKERVRTFFGRVCIWCGKTEKDNGRRLVVHHVNYDKMVCCNNVAPTFVTLCKSCHSATNHNRNYWERVFTEIIDTQYNGKCYDPED